MRHYEKTLLSHLQQDNSQGKNDPLADVKNAMGEIAYSAGNPLTKTEITLQIQLRYFDHAGVEVALGTLPLFMQTSYPVYLFGLTDFYGGYCRERNLINTVYPSSLRNGVLPKDFEQWGIFGYTLTGYVNAFLNAVSEFGDFTYYTGFATALAPPLNEIGVLVKVHCNNVAYGTFLNSFVSDLITINSMRLIVPIANVNQFLNPLIFGYQTLFGKTFADNVDPRQYITSTDFQQQICDIPINLPIDKAVMLGFQLNYDCQNMSIVLFVEKVEPLTHKQNINKR
jgi:hypothetical protein